MSWIRGMRARRAAACDDRTGTLGAIVDATHPAIWFRVDGTITSANLLFEDLCGIAAADLPGETLDRLGFEGADGPDREGFWTDLAAGGTRRCLLRRCPAGAGETWIDAVFAPIGDTEGNVSRVVAIMRDVTAARAEADAQRALVDAIGTSLVLAEFGAGGELRRAGSAFREAFGLSRGEIGDMAHGRFAPSEASASEDGLWDALVDGESRSGEFARTGLDGRKVHLQGSYVPVPGHDGAPDRIVLVASDVSDRAAALSTIGDGLRALSHDDLTVRIPASVTGDLAGMRDAFNTTVERVEKLVNAVNEASVRIAEETDVIATSVQNLSNRNEQQAARVEETSAAMTQMESAIQSNAENTQSATDVATKAAGTAENGSAIVGEAVEAMKEIEESAENIRQVNEVVDSIAFQTNLLALNAGVEAARAGEAGRGFAVVATEVRALAQRAAEAARDIAELVQKSHDAVSRGSALVSRSGDALSEIVGSVSGFAANMRDISTATSEQAQGISSVRQAISEIDITTQRTAAIAEESAAAATQLAGRAVDLRELVSAFGDGTSTQASRPAAKPPAFETNVAYLNAHAARPAAAANDWTDF